MLEAAFWGLVQGLTEFLPISSSGHLVLIPAIFGIDRPGLATTAVLHMGTLAAVVWYYRRDLASLLRFPHDRQARRVLMMLLIGTIPAAVFGLGFNRSIDIIFTEPWIVAVALVVTGVVLATSMLIPVGERRVEEASVFDMIVVGFAQAIALIPGISRSGMTITAANAQGLERTEAARLSFLMAIPVIGGAGLLQGIEMVDRGTFEPSLLVGVVVAAVTGYFAIDALVKLLTRRGLAPFAAYCIVGGLLAYWLV